MVKFPLKRGQMIWIREPAEFVKAKHNLSAFEQKIVSFLFSKIDPLNDKPFTEYKIAINEIKEVFNKDYGEIYNVVKNSFRKLLSIRIEVEDEEKWQLFTIVADTTILKRDGVIKFFISPNFLDLLKKSKHYLKYDITILTYFVSKYSVKLYKIFKDHWEINKKFNLGKHLEFSIEQFKEVLQLPKSYKYGKIKEKVLNIALDEINKYSDIYVTYKEIKKGRKVESIIFYIEENKKNTTKEPKKIEKPKKANKEEQKKENDALKAFRKEIIAKYNNSDKYFMIDDKTFKIKEELLFVDDEALKASEAIKWWKYIYKNKDKIKEVDPIEEEKRAKELFYKELNDRYVGEEVEIPISGGDFIKAKILKILPGQSEELKVMFKGENGKFYAQEMSLNSLKNLSI